MPLFEETHKLYLEKGPRRISPFFIPGMIVNLAAGHVSILFGAKGPNLACATACATGNHAIGEAMRLIREDYADAMIAGGTDAVIVPLAVGGFCAMKALSTRNDEPERASPPVRRRSRRFRDGRGRGNPRPRGARTGDRARRDDLRRDRGLRHVRRRVPHLRALSRRRGGGARDARRAPGCRDRRPRGRLHQRPRNLDTGRRHDRNDRGQDGLRRARRKSSPSRPRSR